jgi:hypothetical protein
MAPNPPILPNKWETDFLYVGDTVTNGSMYYDFTNKMFRLDKVNGTLDLLCNGEKPGSDKECHHLIANGIRYLYWPGDNNCCSCCDDAHGCGMIEPNWM